MLCLCPYGPALLRFWFHMHAVRWLVDGLSGYYYLYISHRFNTQKWADYAMMGRVSQPWRAKCLWQSKFTFFFISSRPDFCKLKPRQCYDFNMAADVGELCKNFRCMFYVNVTMRKFLSYRRSQSELRRKQRNGYECNAPTRPSCSFAQKTFSFSKPLFTRRNFIFFSLSPFISYRLILLIKCKFQ